MSEDDKLPVVRRYGTSDPQSAPNLPTQSGVRSILQAWDEEKQLRLEILRRMRLENNADTIEAQTRGAIAQHRFENVPQEFSIINAEVAQQLASIQLATKQASQEAETVISQFEAVQAENETRKTEAEAAKLAAEVRKRELQKKLDAMGGAASGDLADLKAERLTLREELEALEDAMAKLNDPRQADDPATAAKLRTLRAKHADISDDLDLLRKKIAQLSGLT